MFFVIYHEDHAKIIKHVKCFSCEIWPHFYEGFSYTHNILNTIFFKKKKACKFLIASLFLSNTSIYSEEFSYSKL